MGDQMKVAGRSPLRHVSMEPFQKLKNDVKKDLGIDLGAMKIGDGNDQISRKQLQALKVVEGLASKDSKIKTALLSKIKSIADLKGLLDKLIGDTNIKTADYINNDGTKIMPHFDPDKLDAFKKIVTDYRQAAAPAK